jgi:hypothetical protein
MQAQASLIVGNDFRYQLTIRTAGARAEYPLLHQSVIRENRPSRHCVARATAGSDHCHWVRALIVTTQPGVQDSRTNRRSRWRVVECSGKRAFLAQHGICTAFFGRGCTAGESGFRGLQPLVQRPISGHAEALPPDQAAGGRTRDAVGKIAADHPDGPQASVRMVRRAETEATPARSARRLNDPLHLASVDFSPLYQRLLPTSCSDRLECRRDLPG